MINAYFEDAGSIEHSPTQKHPFYTFVHGTSVQEFPPSAHWHFFIEILYCINGRGIVIINNYTYDFLKDDVIFVFPRDVHMIHSYKDEPFDYVVIKLDPSMLFDAPKEAFAFKYFSQLVEPAPHQLKIIKKDQSPNFTTTDLLKIHELFQEGSYGFEWKVKSYLLAFFYDYALYLNEHNYKIMDDCVSNEDLSNIMPAFDYISDHFNEAISAKEVAEYCHLSYSYFSRQFKKITGIAFTQYLNFLRITEAEKLLLDRNSSITDIGFKVGFTDTSYFIKQFKKFKKMTPKKFVQLIKEDF